MNIPGIPGRFRFRLGGGGRGCGCGAISEAEECVNGEGF